MLLTHVAVSLNHELHLSFVPGLAGGKRKNKKKKKKKKKEEKRVHEKSKIRFDKFILSIMSLGTKKNSPKNSRTPSHDLPTKK